MKSTLRLLVLTTLATAMIAAAQERQPSQKAVDRITKEVRHELLMLPQLDVFDNIAYKVEGYNVTLLGAVTKPVLKSEAEAAVKRIEGVERVDNRIEALPPSPSDDRTRLALYRAIYDYPPLQRYAMPVVKPIRIIVKNGRVDLQGVVDSESDKNTVGIRAKSVPGIFEVNNDLQVVKP
jgi:osmotically-inducible protein OsmY